MRRAGATALRDCMRGALLGGASFDAIRSRRYAENQWLFRPRTEPEVDETS